MTASRFTCLQQLFAARCVMYQRLRVPHAHFFVAFQLRLLDFHSVCSLDKKLFNALVIAKLPAAMH